LASRGSEGTREARTDSTIRVPNGPTAADLEWRSSSGSSPDRYAASPGTCPRSPRRLG